MEIINTITEIREFLKDKKESGYIPTMGNLHKGHLSLVKQSNKKDTCTVVSIFVNPAQFGQGEDYGKYPRTLEKDLDELKAYNVDAVFFPDGKQMYHEQELYIVDDGDLSNNLCGKYRPGHFKGVLTIVLKFFNIIKPERAYFGRKDYQQFVLIKKMAEDFNLDIEIVPCKIVRDSDGLALSSRNAYLSKQERQNALSLQKALLETKAIYRNGELSSKEIIESAKSILNPVKIQYIELVDPDTLKNVEKVNGKTVMAIAAFAGITRLIDNTVLGEDDL